MLVKLITCLGEVGMSFKAWYAQAVRGDNNFAIPYIIIKNEEHYKMVIEQLERLGFGDGNNFSGYGVPVTIVDIWYCDFWNSHIMKVDQYEIRDMDFEVKLEELVALDKRGDL